MGIYHKNITYHLLQAYHNQVLRTNPLLSTKYDCSKYHSMSGPNGKF